MSLPMTVPPPGRFSITTLCFHFSPSFWPTTRARMSTAPAGGKGTTIRTARVGKDCAEAMPAKRRAASNTEKLRKIAVTRSIDKERRFIFTLQDDIELVGHGIRRGAGK